MVILDSSFDFILQEFEVAKDWIASSTPILLAYLSGLLDADGSVLVTRDKYGIAYLFVDYSNSDLNMLECIEDSVRSLGYHCSLRLNKGEGVKTKKYGIIHRKDYWQLSIYGMDKVQEFLGSLKPRHREKSTKRELGLRVVPGELYSKYSGEIVELRSAIKAEVGEFVRRAGLAYLSKHPNFMVPT